MTRAEIEALMHEIVLLMIDEVQADSECWMLVDPAHVDDLRDILRSHRRRKFRAIAAWALGEIGDLAALEDLEAALSSGSDYVRQCALEALLLLDPPPPETPEFTQLSLFEVQP